MSLFHAALQPALDSNGDPISGATWFFYETGTLTPVAVYEDNDLTGSLGVEVEADAAGRFETIYFDDATTYRAILKDGADVTIKDIDPVNSGVDTPDVGDILYPVLAGEVGAFNLQYEVGDTRRYGVFADATTDWETDTAYLTNILRTALAGFTIYFRKHEGEGLFATAWNWTNRYGYDGVTVEFEEGTEFAGVLHIISSGSPVNRKAPTAVSVGTTTTITVAGGHGMSLTDPHYITFTGMGMAALDDIAVFATATSSTVFTVAADTTGQVWSAAGEFHDVPFRNVRFKGTVTTYDRFGAIWLQDFHFDRIHCKSDTTKHATGLEGRGAHLYFGCRDWEGGEIIVDDCGPQSESPTNHAAIAFDGDTNEPQNISIKKLWVKDSQVSGVVLKGGGFDIGQIVVDAWGRGVITVPPEGVTGSSTDPVSYEAQETAAGIWLVRCGNIGQVVLDQLDGYASGRAFATRGIAIEGSFIKWATASSFTITRKGWHIGQIEVRDIGGMIMTVGAFGQAGYVTVGRVDIGKIQSGNLVVTDAVVQLAVGHVWVINGELSYNTVVAKDLSSTIAVKIDPDADASVYGGKITIETHTSRAVWHRGHGNIGNIEIADRTGTDVAPSVTVDGSLSQGAQMGSLFARNPSAATGPLLLFAPISGSILGALDVLGYTGTAATPDYVVKLGANGSNFIKATAGAHLRKTGAQTGTGLLLDGTSDSVLAGWTISGYAIGVDVENANTRLSVIGCFSSGNVDNTDLTDAELLAGYIAAANLNTTFSAP